MSTETESYRHTYAAWAEAFGIFARYDQTTRFGVSAEHEAIYAGPNPDVVGTDDLARLNALGWHIAEEYGCFVHYT